MKNRAGSIALACVFPLVTVSVTLLFLHAALYRAEAPLLLACVLVFWFWVLTLAPWAVMGYWFRNAVIAVGMLLVVFAAWNAMHVTARHGAPDAPVLWILLAAFAMQLVVLYLPLMRRLIRREIIAPSVAIGSPFRAGEFAVAQGGDNPNLNHHAVSVRQRYALDILRIGRFGMRGETPFPTGNEQYRIFGTPLYSPVAGTVVAASDGAPDDGTYGNPMGNHVVIAMADGTQIFLAHVRQGSVKVRVGDVVTMDSLLGEVGNSGRSTEPHLHIHAEQSSVGVPIRLDGRLLTRNSRFGL